MKLKNDKTLKIALTAVFACIVFVLSYFGSCVRIGTVSIALTMIPLCVFTIFHDFFLAAATEKGQTLGYFVLAVIIGINFVFEFLTTVVITPLLAKPLLALKKRMEQ